MLYKPENTVQHYRMCDGRIHVQGGGVVLPPTLSFILSPPIGSTRRRFGVLAVLDKNKETRLFV